VVHAAVLTDDLGPSVTVITNYHIAHFYTNLLMVEVAPYHHDMELLRSVPSIKFTDSSMSLTSVTLDHQQHGLTRDSGSLVEVAAIKPLPPSHTTSV
jgi:hypothetical protein